MSAAVHEQDRLEELIASSVAPHAEQVDREGRFPQEAIDALAAAGYLGLVSDKQVGGGGQGMRAAAMVVERIARTCGSTAMILLMHYAATAAIEALGRESIRREIAAGKHLSSVAFSEAGSRSHFWIPLSSAAETQGGVRLDAEKSWVTAANEAHSFVRSSRPLTAPGPMTLWLVPADTSGLHVGEDFDGLGLRGNASRPLRAAAAIVGADAMLGADGSGLDEALRLVLPWFLVLNAAFSLGLSEAVVAVTGSHLRRTRLLHLGESLAEQPVPRLDYGRMRIRTDTVRCCLEDALAALEGGRGDATERVLAVKVVASEAALAVTDLAMKVCGGAAFRKELGIERRFRDARAARVMAPTTDALLDFVARIGCDMPLFDTPVPA